VEDEVYALRINACPWSIFDEGDLVLAAASLPDAVLDQGLLGGTLPARDDRRDQRAANPR
jgi:hypothetical protein